MTRGVKNPSHLGFPARLRRARKAAGLSCAELSRRAGIGTYVVASIEAGHRIPRLPAVEKLGDALRLPPAFLAYGLEAPWAPRECDELRSAGLAERARAARDALGLSLRDVAQRMTGREVTAASTVHAIERGTTPTLDTLEALAVALGVSPSWLAYGTGEMAATKRRRRSVESSVRVTRVPHREDEASATSDDYRGL